MGHGIVVLFGCLAASLSASAAASAAAPPPSDSATAIKWINLPDPRLEMRGLPWWRENAPDLWRLPKSAQAKVPKAVWNRAVAPDGGRIRLSCNSTVLGLRVQALHEPTKRCFFDAFVNGEYAGSVSPAGTQRVDLVLFEHKKRAWKDITIYLPHKDEVRVFAVGLDPNVELKAPPAFALNRPLVCYGSSVLQGSGAAHPSHTYPAAAARRLNLDFVNLGFGGAGKGEVEVVALVNQLDACCYLFDLGKSYGAPTPERYNRMLDAIRASHPEVPIFCVTPIYSTKEENDPDYKKRSEDLRNLMRQAATDRRQAGDKLMFVVEGLELFGEPDKALFTDPQHPDDTGNERMAERLAPVLEKVVLGKGRQVPGIPASGTNAVPARLP
jgi:lysophospholipase L1-like esterase